MSEAFADEQAQAAMDADALFAFGTDADVGFEVRLFALAEVSVEEEVGNPFHIVTDHSCGSPWQFVVTTLQQFETEVRMAEFR
ncbi:MAG TPA: hypothetical protein VNN08_12935 [Thermoanaerobaculia bacterium]|nr:hypothetical protein [Thermoanaerobaculia bacterium]